MADSYDAVLVVAFGGPEGPADVLPFLENVLRGKNVPRDRMLAVAEHYYQFGGVSPINAQTRTLIAALEAELSAHGPKLPIYWGNRNWHPLLPDTLTQMKADGVRRALALVVSAYSSYSSCRQYLENIDDARQIVGGDAPQIEKLRAFYNHPNFIAAWTERTAAALAQVPESRRAAAEVLFTAHSIPAAMAGGCRYEPQLLETCRLVADSLNIAHWKLVYQSRSGPPTQHWLDPDICEHLRSRRAEIRAAGDELTDAVIVPIGFLSDHMEVIYDLDTEARAVCDELCVNYVRAATVGTHPKVVEMYRLLIAERISEIPARLAVGNEGPSHDVCPADCCPSGRPAGR